MVKAAEELVLELEPTHDGSRHDPGPHDLQRDAPMRPLLFRLVHDAHRAFADEREDPERADACRLGAPRSGDVLCRWRVVAEGAARLAIGATAIRPNAGLVTSWHPRDGLLLIGNLNDISIAAAAKGARRREYHPLRRPV